MLVRTSKTQIINMDHVNRIVYDEVQKRTTFCLSAGTPVAIDGNWIDRVVAAPHTAVLDCTGTP